LVTVQVWLERYLTFVWYYLNAEFQVNALMIIVYARKNKIQISFFFFVILHFTVIVHVQVDYYLIIILVMMLIDAFVVVMYLKIFEIKKEMDLFILPILLSLKFK
jgi:hypothetical protein